jgi:biopolymer transport protein ExbD
MITRPLGLSDRLRPAPRSFDGLFFVNAVLLGLFFALFGSRFVVSPGVELENPDFHVPVSAGALAGAVPTRLVIDIPRPGVAYTPEGQLNYQRLGDWLRRQAARQPGGRVLVRADAHSVPARDLLEVYELIRAAGFEVQLAAEPPAMPPAAATGPAR